MSSERVLILVVDDHAARSETIVRTLEAAGFRVSVRADSLEGLIAVEVERPRLIVLHWGMPFIGGEIFVYALKAGLPEPPPVIAIAGPDTDRDAVFRAGADILLPVVPDAEELLSAVRGLIGEA